MIRHHKAGLVLAALLGGMHALWTLLVAFGWAQLVMDFIFRLHFIKPVFEILPFQLATALMLVALTCLIGYVLGVCFAWLWNQLRR
ncbi:hypothetical protein [Novimethylophilus kurashikiensis]|nr:hypothetical protein [Novimethylophilus kurashikiensis]